MMNKIIWISAAVLSVAACAKNEVIPVNSGENQEITFNVAPKTKADPKKEAFSTNNVFASWAYYLPGTVKWDKKDGDNTTDPITPATTPALYINGAVISNTKPDGTDGVWKAEKTYYWPKNGSLTFFAYSLNKKNLDLTGGDSFFRCGVSSGIYGAIDLKVNPNTDFLVAEIAKDRTGNVMTHFTEGVPTLFRHKLSNIVFKVAAGSYDRTSFKLKSIQFKNIGCFGSYSQVPETFSRGVQSVLYNPYYSESEEGQEQEITTTLTEVDKGSVKNWIFVPQLFDDETGEIEVVYEIITEVATDKFVTQTVPQTIKLKELFPTVPNQDPLKVSGGWEMGKKYTINLTFTLNEILWDPAVQDWDPVTAPAAGYTVE